MLDSTGIDGQWKQNDIEQLRLEEAKKRRQNIIHETLKKKEAMQAPVTVLAGEIVRGTPNSAGFDLLSRIDFTFAPGDTIRIPVTLVTKMAPGVVGIIKDKSGMAGHMRITTRAGVIDGDYPNEWEVVLVNESQHYFTGKVGKAIAQVIFIQFLVPDKYTLKTGERVGGFGSTDSK